MRAFPVVLPSGARYWTVLDEDLAVVPVADGLGRCGSAATARSRRRRAMRIRSRCSCAGVRARAGPGRGRRAAGVVHDLAGARRAGVRRGPARPRPGGAGGAGGHPGAGSRRVNGALTAVRGMVVHAVAAGQASGDLVALLYEVADDRDLPAAARGEDGRIGGGCGPGTGCTSRRRRSAGPVTSRSSRCCGRACAGAGPADRAADGPARAAPRRAVRAAPLRCAPAGRLAAAGMRGRPRAPGSRSRGQPERGLGQSRRQRAAPLDFLVVQAFDT